MQDKVHGGDVSMVARHLLLRLTRLILLYMTGPSLLTNGEAIDVLGRTKYECGRDQGEAAIEGSALTPGVGLAWMETQRRERRDGDRGTQLY